MSANTNAYPNRGRFFGIPLGDFGLFASLLMALSAGFLSFFLGTFLGILGLLIYNAGGHHTADYSDSYRLIGLPIGVGVLVVSLVFFGGLWIRRKVTGH